MDNTDQDQTGKIVGSKAAEALRTAESYVDSGKPQHAIAHLQQALGGIQAKVQRALVFTRVAELQFSMAEQMAQQGKYPEALELLERMLSATNCMGTFRADVVQTRITQIRKRSGRRHEPPTEAIQRFENLKASRQTPRPNGGK